MSIFSWFSKEVKKTELEVALEAADIAGAVYTKALTNVASVVAHAFKNAAVASTVATHTAFANAAIAAASTSARKSVADLLAEAQKPAPGAPPAA